MILGRESNTNNNERVKIEKHENLINFEPEMANQPLKLPLKEVVKLVTDFDGKNIPLDEYIEKLKQANKNNIGRWRAESNSDYQNKAQRRNIQSLSKCRDHKYWKVYSIYTQIISIDG